MGQLQLKLHPRLEQDCLVIGRFLLSYLLLMQDANYPWLILVPDRKEVSEIFELSEQDQKQLAWESSYLAKALAQEFRADKINIAALGNVVPQLHIHHIVRYRDDKVWPAPVWGKLPAAPYTEEAVATVVTKLKEVLTDGFEFYV